MTPLPTAALTTQNVKPTSTFIIAPFLCNAIFNKKSSDPVELIILAQDAATEFDARHRGVEGFKTTSAKEHVTTFTNWALAIHLGKLKEARFNIDPDNNELQNFLTARHAKCILLALGETGTTPFSIARTVGQPGHLEHEVIKSLGEGLKQMGEAADEANSLKREEIKLKGEEDKKKKDHIKEMHPSISNMILMASAIKPDIQGKYANSFKSFYNSKNHGYADLELHHQFEAKSFHNVGFAEGTTLALWSGLLRRSNPTGPRNCTPFAFCEL
jgi:hypothetical protein